MDPIDQHLHIAERQNVKIMKHKTLANKVPLSLVIHSSLFLFNVFNFSGKLHNHKSFLHSLQCSGIDVMYVVSFSKILHL